MKCVVLYFVFVVEGGVFAQMTFPPPPLSTGPPGPPGAAGQPDASSLPDPSSAPSSSDSVGSPNSLESPNSLPGVDGTQAPYTCVPTGTCNTNANNPNTIDPRIVTPNQPLCPVGQEACYGDQTGTSQCGVRYVGSVSTADGAATCGAYPWQAYIINETSYTGSGVLLDQYHVLTAAHKVNMNVASPSNVKVFMGVCNPTNMGTAQNGTAATIIIHEQFNANTLINDLAIIRLSQPIALGFQSSVGTACLPSQGQSFVGFNCIVSGWGQTSFGANDAPTQAQKQVNVPIVSYDVCRTSMMRADILGGNVDRYLDQNGEICAGGGNQLDACTQDGGSPLVCPDSTTGRFNVAGLVIWGKRCGQPGVYGVYVNVPYYKDWIDQKIACLNSGAQTC